MMAKASEEEELRNVTLCEMTTDRDRSWESHCDCLARAQSGPNSIWAAAVPDRGQLPLTCAAEPLWSVHMCVGTCLERGC